MPLRGSLDPMILDWERQGISVTVNPDTRFLDNFVAQQQNRTIDMIPDSGEYTQTVTVNAKKWPWPWIIAGGIILVAVLARKK